MIERSLRSGLPLLLLPCDSLMFVRESPDRKRISNSYPEQEHIILIIHFKKEKNGHNIDSNMSQYALYTRSTKIYPPKYLLNCDRLIVVYTSKMIFLCINIYVIWKIHQLCICKDFKWQLVSKVLQSFLSTTFENISSLSSVGTDKQQMKLRNITLTKLWISVFKLKVYPF